MPEKSFSYKPAGQFNPLLSIAEVAVPMVTTLRRMRIRSLVDSRIPEFSTAQGAPFKNQGLEGVKNVLEFAHGVTFLFALFTSSQAATVASIGLGALKMFWTEGSRVAFNIYARRQLLLEDRQVQVA